MVELTYRLSFNTPAFLGNAEQAAQWRTPPIKALLRQWWRVAYAADHPHGVNVSAMRQAEGQLFGVAADREGDSRRSQVRLRLSHWSQGQQKNWDGLEQRSVFHEEVEQTRQQVGPLLYLGFGPLTVDRATKKTVLTKDRAAIKAKDSANLQIAFRDDIDAPRLKRALHLMHHYGTLGGRSRNGWGSFHLSPVGESTAPIDLTLDASLTCDWRAALAQDWPSAIGKDEQGPLIWQTESSADWTAVMRRLAEVKIGLRTQFKFNSGKNAAAPEDRHWLSYPVTNHAVRDWGGNARLPNSLRFKVRVDSDGKLRGVIVHMPCLPPPAFRPDRNAIPRVWQQVHRHLDAAPGLTRIPV